MSRKTIAIDVDDVLSAENDAMREFVNTAYGLSLTAEDYTIEAPYWGYWEAVWGVGAEEGRERYKAYLESGTKAKHRSVEGAIEGINYLSQRYELIVVTSRDDRLIDLTQEWLEYHFPKTFRTVEFVPVWSKTKKISKAVICKELQAAYLIDDSLEHCSLVAEEGIKALLFGNYGWNRAETLPQGITRVRDWRAVKKYFDAKH